jgi:hypothetical protein
VRQSNAGHSTRFDRAEAVALTTRVDGFTVRTIAFAGQFSGVDVPSSITSARSRHASEVALTIAVDDFTLRAMVLVT